MRNLILRQALMLSASQTLATWKTYSLSGIKPVNVTDVSSTSAIAYIAPLVSSRTVHEATWVVSSQLMVALEGSRLSSVALTGLAQGMGMRVKE